jgi:hypothetical protein
MSWTKPLLALALIAATATAGQARVQYKFDDTHHAVWLSGLYSGPPCAETEVTGPIRARAVDPNKPALEVFLIQNSDNAPRTWVYVQLPADRQTRQAVYDALLDLTKMPRVVHISACVQEPGHLTLDSITSG